MTAEQSVDEFIESYKGLALSYVCKKAVRRRIFDRHLILSSALQACWDTFTACENNGKLGVKQLECGILRNRCSQVFYHNAIKYGYAPDRKRRYFPTGWVSWEDFFSPKNEINFSKTDLEFLLESDALTPSEKLFLRESALGLTPDEIAKKLGYAAPWVRKALKNIHGRCKEMDTVKAVTKWGCRGPYGKRRRKSADEEN